MSNIKYPAASLAVAVAFTTNMTDLLTAMEITITPGSRAAMWARLRQLGIDTSHWVRSTRTYDDEQLAQAVSVSQSVAEVMRRLGIIPAGGSHFHISNRIRRAGLDTAHFLGSACGLGPVWQGKSITLAVDHINGDWLDNRLENLRFLCPNCHAQTSTWCRRKPAP